MNLYSRRFQNIRKTWILMAVFLAFVIFVGWILSNYYNNREILWIALIFSLAMNFFGYWFSDKIALSLSRAKPVKFEDNPELYRIVENLCLTAGLPVPKIYILPERAMNAFATGRNPKHGALALTQGLIERLDRSELEGVISHELMHIGNRDTLLQTVVVVLVGLLAVVSDVFLRSRLFGFSNDSDERENNGGVLAIIGLIMIILSPIIAQLIQLAISRKREFLADASGALLTRYPEGLASALEKIESDGTPMRFAGNATAHLYISNPFSGKKVTNRFAKLFMTHPPINERVAALRGMEL